MNLAGGAIPARGDGDEAQSLDESLEIRRLLSVLFERKGQILFVAALVVIAAAIATFRAEQLYRSIAMVHIDPEPVQVLPYREVDLPSFRPNFELFMRSQEQILKGPTLVSRIQKRLQSEPDSARLAAEAGQLASRLAIQRLPDTQIMLLGYVAPDPEVAARVANLYADEYIKLHFENRQATRKSAHGILQRELTLLEQKVQQSEKELVDYAHANGIPVATTNEGLLQQKLSTLNGQLADVEADAYRAESKLNTIRQASAGDFPQHLVTPLISSHMSALVQLENDLTILRSRFGENWPDVVQKRSEITLARERLEREKASMLAQALDQATLEYQAAENRRRTVAASMQQHQKEMKTLEAASVQYNIIRRDVDTNRRMYEEMLERLRQTSVAPVKELGGFQLLEPATPSRRPDSPRPRRDLTMAALLGIALGVCVAFARDFWNRTLTSVEDVERFAVLPALGLFPRVESLHVPGSRLFERGRRALLDAKIVPLPAALKRIQRPTDTELSQFERSDVLQTSDAAAAEAARSICASILLSQSSRPPRVLLVTSPTAHEGKTTVARAIGQTLAEGGSRTLLVECDLRRPSFAKIFGIGTEGGLSLFLAGHAGSVPAIHPTATRNLSVVAGGVVPPNPPALLNSPKMRDFLAGSLSAFDFVILDGPPALPVADARILAQTTEGVILVARAGVTSRDAIRRTRISLHTVGANILGVALNDPDRRRALTNYAYDAYYE